MICVGYGVTRREDERPLHSGLSSNRERKTEMPSTIEVRSFGSIRFQSMKYLPASSCSHLRKSLFLDESLSWNGTFLFRRMSIVDDSAIDVVWLVEFERECL